VNGRHSESDLPGLPSPTTDCEVMPAVCIRAHTDFSQQSLSQTLLLIDTLQS
jgi:hypothetical protein